MESDIEAQSHGAQTSQVSGRKRRRSFPPDGRAESPSWKKRFFRKMSRNYADCGSSETEDADLEQQMIDILDRPLPIEELSPNTLCFIEKRGGGKFVEGIISCVELLYKEFHPERNSPPEKEFPLLHAFKKVTIFFGSWREAHSALSSVQDGLPDYNVGRNFWGKSDDQKMLEWLKRMNDDFSNLVARHQQRLQSPLAYH